MTTARFLPTTASPGLGDYFEAYKQLAIEGTKEIISIQMSSKVSGGFQAAAVAQTMMQDEFPDVRIEVVDTQTAALSQGWMVIEAARGALAGLCLDRLLDTVKQMIPIARMIQMADTLKYLYMGGRIGKAQAPCSYKIGTLIHAENTDSIFLIILKKSACISVFLRPTLFRHTRNHLPFSGVFNHNEGPLRRG